MDTEQHIEAVILAGGKGTRLAPYTDELPKPLVKVGDTPIIEILLKTLAKHNITRLRLAVNHMAEMITDALGDGSRFDMEITYSHEDKPLSTVGPLTLIPDLPDHFLVINGDILTDLNYRALFNHHLEQGLKLTVATCRRENLIDYGVIETGDTGLVTDFQEKPSHDFTVSAGVYVFSRAMLDVVPKGEKFGFDDLMETLLERNEPIATYPHEGYWLDIGRLEDYDRAQRDVDRINKLLG